MLDNKYINYRKNLKTENTCFNLINDYQTITKLKVLKCH